MSSSGMLRRVALVRTDISDEGIASIIRVTRIGEIGTTLAVTSSRSTLIGCGDHSTESDESYSSIVIECIRYPATTERNIHIVTCLVECRRC
jgi:hypothetical protein